MSQVMIGMEKVLFMHPDRTIDC